MTISWRNWILLLTLAVSLAGCTLSGRGRGRSSGSADNVEPGPIRQVKAADNSADLGHDNGVEVHAIRYAELDPIIRRNLGKVVVVDFWGIHCPPCRAGFPYLVQMHHKYGKHGLVVVSVNMDDPGNKLLRDETVTFLKDKKATFRNLALAQGEIPMQWVDWRGDPATGGTGFAGEIPFTEVYDRTGRLALHQVGVDHDQLDELVQKLLLMDAAGRRR